MADVRIERLRDELVKHAATFLEQESSRKSLITVTRVELSPDIKHALVLISVFPTDQERQAIDFTKRHEKAFRGYLAKKARLRRLPKITFALDQGERNRQRMDELSNE